MSSIVRPNKQASFSELQKAKQPFADRLDSQIQNLIDAIASTQAALADIRRDDGQIRNNAIGPEQLAAELRHSRKEIDDIESKIIDTAAAVGGVARQISITTRDIDLRARDAETAATVATRASSAACEAASDAVAARDVAVSKDATVEAWTTDAENWGNYAQAQASNAEYQQQQAAGWAEYLAGPVVDSNAAPAYIQSTPFGHGLYYQPVEGYGGNGGLWSAKWWAIYAAQLVGPWSFYYLGGWTDPPVPGSVNPDTGIKVPSPLPPGSFYYDIDAGTVYFWNGSAWISPLALAAGVTSRFVYLATAGQTIFTGADYTGATPVVGQSPSDVHLNGVKLVPTLDYSISGNTLTLAVPASVNSVIQWDLLVPSSALAPGAVNSYKVTLTGAVDGVNTTFTMKYTDPTTGLQPVSVTSTTQLQVSIDGIVQEPGADYVTSGATLTMATAPVVNSRFWVVWFSNAGTGGGGLTEAPADGQAYSRKGSTASWVVAASGGGAPGGATTQVQFNNAGAFGGSANFTWDGAKLGLGAYGYITTAGGGTFIGYPGYQDLMFIGSSGYDKVIIGPGSAFGWATSNANLRDTSDTMLFRIGAGIIGQSNATNPQTFQSYNTTNNATAPTNYERGVFDWTTTANTLTIGTQKGGTGASRDMTLRATGSLGVYAANSLFLSASGSDIYYDGSSFYHATTGFVLRSSGSLELVKPAAQVIFNGDTGLTRPVAKVLAIGDGTPGDTSGTISVASVVLRGGAQPKVTVATTAPSSPAVNDLWVDIN